MTLIQPRPLELSQEDNKLLAQLLVDQAVASAAGVAGYYNDLLLIASLPAPFRAEVAGTFTGPAPFNARRLIQWATSKKGGNPGQPGWTTLGTLLSALLEEGTLGLEQVAVVAGIIESRRLYLSAEAGKSFRAKYGVPDRQSPGTSAPTADIGPDVDWQGPTDAVQLQSWLGPEPKDFSLDFLQAAVRRARAVCKVEFPATGSGSGVLIAPDLVLTNHHVVFGQSGDDGATLPAGCVVSFSGLAGTGGPSSVSGSLDGAAGALVARSQALDYALLRLPESLAAAQGLDVAPMSPKAPVARESLNLLHHPGGQALRVTLCDGGVTSILNDRGFLQYVTRSAPGSSGAPCFDDEWHLIGIHHAERSRPFGRVGEGILMQSIYKEISQHLG